MIDLWLMLIAIVLIFFFILLMTAMYQSLCFEFELKEKIYPPINIQFSSHLSFPSIFYVKQFLNLPKSAYPGAQKDAVFARWLLYSACILFIIGLIFRFIRLY